MENNVMPNRNIAHRIYIKGCLKLITPAVLGGGESDGSVDLALMRDPLDGTPLLTGASLAGALRDYLRQRKYGFFKNGVGVDSPPWQEFLFGSANDEKDESNESWIITSDRCASSTDFEVRDNVSLDAEKGVVRINESLSETSTAIGGAKFDFEALSADALFPVDIELLLPDDKAKKGTLLKAAAIALQGLEKGEIPIGGRKTRGFGKCQVKEWQIWDFDLATLKGLDGWLNWDWKSPPSGEKPGNFIEELLNVGVSDIDARHICIIQANLHLKDSLIIRSDSGNPNEPDSLHLTSKRDGENVPILSGTSLAGPLRHRCEVILNTLEVPDAEAFLNGMFGWVKGDKGRASRLMVEESTLENYQFDPIQSRIKIDRFTGGAYPNALFDEKPVFPKANDDATTLTIKLELRDPQDEEIRLLLFVLKDLSLGDLTFGGESGIGRGAFVGREIRLSVDHFPPNHLEWIITQDKEGKLSFSGKDKDALFKRFVTDFEEKRD